MVSKKQIFIHTEKPSASKMEQLENGPLGHSAKPAKGGIWTSEYTNQKHFSDWGNFIKNGQVGFLSDEMEVWELTVRDSVDVYTIKSKEDLLQISSKNKQGKFYIDFESVSEEYDGINATRDGLSNIYTRYEEPIFSSWEVESTIWFNWCFSSCNKIGTIKVR